MKDLHKDKCKSTPRLRPSLGPRNDVLRSFTLLVLVPVFAFITMFSMVAWLKLYMFPGHEQVSKLQTKEVNDFPLECFTWNQTSSCPKSYPKTHKTLDRLVANTCPDYFRWIHEDLRHWKEKGITRDMVEIAKPNAHFRLIILDGKAYVEKYKKSIQTRDLFTLWGFQQLLRRYPGRIPDLELMFNCDDRPVYNMKEYFKRPNPGPPPLFKYCSDPSSFDIVSPDWSFWGWAETNQKPWELTMKDIKEGNKRVKWKDRVPYAYWKGNPSVSPIRAELGKCNLNDKNKVDWNTRLFFQDWIKESVHGYKNSNIEDQCTYRYKIYIEGWSWSVSEKYILACDSPTLYVTPRYYTFFARGMNPLEHFWPIRYTNMCKSLKFAVEWGNNHTSKAQEIGGASSRFIQEEMKMDYIYDYKLHLLTEYAKLLKFKPTVPQNAVELCSESMACFADGNWRKFMEGSFVRHPTDVISCSMPPPYDSSTIKAIVNNRTSAIRQVEMWEDEYWKNQEPKL